VGPSRIPSLCEKRWHLITWIPARVKTKHMPYALWNCDGKVSTLSSTEYWYSGDEWRAPNAELCILCKSLRLHLEVAGCLGSKSHQLFPHMHHWNDQMLENLPCNDNGGGWC
jgi:hypothetical protein